MCTVPIQIEPLTHDLKAGFAVNFLERSKIIKAVSYCGQSSCQVQAPGIQIPTFYLLEEMSKAFFTLVNELVGQLKSLLLCGLCCSTSKQGILELGDGITMVAIVKKKRHGMKSATSET